MGRVCEDPPRSRSSLWLFADSTHMQTLSDTAGFILAVVAASVPDWNGACRAVRARRSCRGGGGSSGLLRCNSFCRFICRRGRGRLGSALFGDFSFPSWSSASLRSGRRRWLDGWLVRCGSMRRKRAVGGVDRRAGTTVHAARGGGIGTHRRAAMVGRVARSRCRKRGRRSSRRRCGWHC